MTIWRRIKCLLGFHYYRYMGYFKGKKRYYNLYYCPFCGKNKKKWLKVGGK